MLLSVVSRTTSPLAIRVQSVSLALALSHSATVNLLPAAAHVATSVLALVHF
jgi:hypothetical protein